MIRDFVKEFMEKREELEKVFSSKHPEDYTEIVRAVVRALHREFYTSMDENRITLIDHGDEQGTLVYVIGETGYQPSTYWYVKISYGSCSANDTLVSIVEGSDGPPTAIQVQQYMTLALHIVQKLRCMKNLTVGEY